MDLYITDSLQDMLDMDIKSEMATDLNSITDFSDTFGLNFSDLPPLLDMDTDNASTWLNTSSFVHNLDLYGSEANAVMVNPNSVMPSTFTETPTKKIVNEDASNLMLTSTASPEESQAATMQSPKEEKSHLTFSPNPIKIPKVKEPEEIKPTPPAPIPAKKSLEEATQMVIYVRKQDSNVVKDLLNDLESKKVHKVVNMHTPSPAVRVKTAPGEIIKINNNKKCSIVSSSQRVTQQLGTKTIISGNIHILDAQQSRTILANTGSNKATILFDNSLGGSRRLLKSTEGFSLVHGSAKYVSAASASLGEFPKPAYSYSCLIAMALKNSRTGSLPVSEIYNFMCQHFPYFKTAPNGWKNSVRHNLSLNKCFEKIEKPSTTGSQRKGCLWAMNPSKVGKMDEEVQKWSRKDPQAIKKAMVYPENLEALERGEMKYSGLGGELDVDDADDVDPDGEVDPDGDLDLDTEVKTEEEDNTINEQELSDQEGDQDQDQEVEVDLSAGRLLASSASSEELSDVEILEHSYEEIDMEVHKSVKLDVSLSDSYSVPAKRSKPSFLFRAAPASRRKSPLVTRVALV